MSNELKEYNQKIVDYINNRLKELDYLLLLTLEYKDNLAILSKQMELAYLKEFLLTLNK